MERCKLGNGGAVSGRNTPLSPSVQALMAQIELSSHEACANRVDEVAIGVSFAHTPAYQRCVDDASAISLMATATALMRQRGAMQMGERIKAAYLAMGISQAEAARRSGCSPQRFGNYITKNRAPDIATLMRIAKALDTTPDALMGLNAQSDDVLREVLERILELEGFDPARADTIAKAALATQRLLRALPDADAVPDRSRIAAHAVWSAQSPTGQPKALHP